jgi:very-short-patch-repair endonuclease
VTTLATQVRVRTFRVDVVVARGDFRLALEIDGRQWHRMTEEQAQRDAGRQRQIVAAGYTVVRFTARESLADPDRCWSEIDAIIRARTAAPHTIEASARRA